MFLLPGYQVKEKIYSSATVVIYRGWSKKLDKPVILKMLQKQLPTAKDLVRYRQEYEITKRLSIDGAIGVYALELTRDAQVLVFEDIQGESLRALAKQARFSIEQVLALGVKIAESLRQLHSANIIHKDINPGNIIYNPSTDELKIIDFGISTVLPREKPMLTNVTSLEGTLAYIAPEQSGRMNRVMDYRSDFYSFGVTLYELLTGRLPFQSKDEMELIHCHIAKSPLSPLEVDTQIPRMLSRIVMKLMAKMAEDRYQSALGVKRDLLTCTQEMQSGSNQEFALGNDDIWDKFHLPQKLYGREKETAMLLNAFQRVCAGASEMIMVAGYSGIGKTSLIASTYKPITEHRGYFVTGKFDQYQRNVPYSAVVNAFRELVRQLITESDQSIQQWREKLKAALGANAQVIINVIAEVKMITGPQPPVEELEPMEEQNRFNLVFQSFIRTFCQPEHPLTIFLDDLQWADSASLKLLTLMMVQTSTLFLIGAYRNNEVSDAHPLMMTLSDIEKTGRKVTTITLSPLPLHQVQQYIADALNSSGQNVAPLAKLVYKKTAGNPFFMAEFLKSLDTERLLSFDYWKEVWVWDIQRIQARDITDNVVALMASKLQQLDQSTREALQFAACIGNQFDVKTLAVILQQSPRVAARNLLSAMRQDLILPIGVDYKLMTLEIASRLDSDARKTCYKFAHDRIQQAAYSLIPDHRKLQVHHQIGHLLLQNTTDDEMEQHIFLIVDQLNMAADKVDGITQQLELARLNLIAGVKAKHSAAYEPAFNYLKAGIDVLPTSLWRTPGENYALMLSLHHEITEAAYLGGILQQMDVYLDVVLNHAHDLLDQVKVYEVKVQALISQQKQVDAVQTALKVLKLLDVTFPKNPNDAAVMCGLYSTKFFFYGRKINTLVAHHEMQDAHHLAVIRILAKIWSAAYQTAPSLMPLIVFKMVQYSLRHGNTHESVLAYAWYGLLLCGMTDDIESGYEFGEIALKLLDKFHARQLQACLLFVVHSFIKHWRDPVSETLEPLQEAYRVGLETGALEFSAYAGVVYCYHGLMIGKALDALESDMLFFSKGIKHAKQEISLNYIHIFHQMVLNLRGTAKDPTALIGQACDESILLPIMTKANDRTGIFFIYLAKLMLSFLFGRYQQAYTYSTKLADYLDSVTASFVVSIYYYFDALAGLAVYGDAGQNKKTQILKRVKKNQKKMKIWARTAPANNAHKYYLVEAELARVLGQTTAAAEHYNHAIQLADENKYVNDEALALELAAEFYQQRGQLRAWQHHLRDAHTLYTHWGATMKAEQLEKKLPFRPATVKAQYNTTDRVKGTTIIEDSLDMLDLTSVIKASQAISGEFILDRLIKKLLTIVLQTAGATKSAFFLGRNGSWTLEAISYGYDDSVERPGIPLEDLDPISYPKDIVQFVIRTEHILVLNNVAEETSFVDSKYLKDNEKLSLLCMPIIQQTHVMGVLFLENNLITDTFTDNRIATLEILASQIAISIENALYYEQLEEKLEIQRERDLIKETFGYYVPKEVSDNLINGKLNVGGENRVVSVLFSDIRGFTTFSEKMRPEKLLYFLKAYFDEMTEIIEKAKGTLIEYVGDEIMSLFGAPAESENHARDACIAALTMQRRLKELRKDGHSDPIYTGIGINTGEMLVGVLGSSHLFRYGAIGDNVNVGSRIEGATKQYGVDVIISEDTYRMAQDHIQVRELDYVLLKGKYKPKRLYELIGLADNTLEDDTLALMRSYDDGLKNYQSGNFHKAMACFEQCLHIKSFDKPAKLFLRRSRQRCNNQPKGDWQGIHELEMK